MSQQVQKEEKFTGIRGFFWPIHGYELKKFVPMALMQFFILFVYTILRNTKDALVTHDGGAAVIPFLKGYIVFPASILFVIIYAKLVDRLCKKNVFFSVTSFFMLFFGIFGLLIFPNRNYVHPSADFITYLKTAVPFLEHFLSIFATWSFSSFFVMAELWGSVMNSLLFWQFANEITKTNEAKRFYSMFILISNISLMFAGGSVKIFSSIGSDTISIGLICLVTVLSSLLIMYLYNRVYGNEVAPREQENAGKELDTNSPTPKKKKVKLSAGESVKLLFSSRYLLMITLLVLSYGVSINLIELMWKNQLRIAFDSISAYNSFMGNLSIGTGIATIVTILLSKSVVSRFGWFWGAVMTPVAILITGLTFFGCIFFSEALDPLASMLGITSVMLGVWIGTIQNILSKSIKYGLFDPTKEMAYIPLDDELKAKGKAAVDVLGARLGKAGGGYISSTLLMIAPSIGMTNTVSGISPILAVCVIGVIILWIYAIVSLSKLYKEQLEKHEKAMTPKS